MILPLCIKRGLAVGFALINVILLSGVIKLVNIGQNLRLFYTINRDNLEQLFKVTYSNNEWWFPLIGGQIFERQIRNPRYPKRKKLERTNPKNCQIIC